MTDRNQASLFPEPEPATEQLHILNQVDDQELQELESFERISLLRFLTPTKGVE